MSAPDRIWIDGAVNANVWAEQKTDCTLSGVAAYEYVRADLCDPTQDERPRLSVWFGEMPESNGRKNWTASLHRTGDDPHFNGFCFARSEYPDRVKYEADRMRWIIGQSKKRPDILDYDEHLHSGYTAPPSPTQDARVKALEAENARLRDALSLYSCDDGCNDCPETERDRVSCGWTALRALEQGKGCGRR